MGFTGKISGIDIDFLTRKQKVTLTVNEDFTKAYEKLKDCEKLDISIKKHREKRSIDANNYMWLLLIKLAPLLHTTKDELYLFMLERHGTHYYIPVQDEEIEKISSLFRIVYDRGEITLETESGKKVKCHQLQCYKGSSLYDTAEMAALLDGVVQDAQDNGIDTATPDEIRQMKERWGVKIEKKN